MKTLYSPACSPAALLGTLGTLILLAVGSTPTLAWSPTSQSLIGRHALRLAPSDFSGQLAKHEREFLRGLAAPFDDRDGSLHQQNPEGGRLAEAIVSQVERIVGMIKEHFPFSEIAYQAGVLVHYMNDANNPLNCSNADKSEGSYYADFLGYLESTEPRLALLFYGLDPLLEKGDVESFVATTLSRCRKQYPLVGKEYRRIGKLPGSRYFDDRSTAFGVASLAHSRAVTDAALLLRYLWIEAGGADWRSPPGIDDGRRFLLPPLESAEP